MKPYPKYRDSGVEWIGEVPEGWEVKKLKWLAKVRLSNIDKKTREGELTVELCNYIDVYYNDNITSDIEFMKATARQDQIDILSLAEGDVLITKDSESPDDIAVPAFVPSSLSGVVCGYHLAHVHPYQKHANGNYLFWSFSTHGISDQFEISANGVTRFGIGKQAIDNSVFLSPPLVEQTAIAAYLDRKTTQIDNLISKKQKLIELLKEERAAIINQAVTKGLNPDVPMKDSGIEWLGEIPAHWEVKKGRYLFEIVSGYAPEQIDFSKDGTETYLRVDDLNENGNGFFLEFGKARCNLGPIPAYNENILLFPKRGAAIFTNKVRITAIQCLFDTNLMGLSVDEKIANTEFIAFCLLARRLDDIADTSTVPQINNKHIYPLSFPYPPLEEQLLIVKTLNKRIEGLDLSIHKVDHSIQLLKEFRTALISEVVTGKIDVRDEGLNG